MSRGSIPRPVSDGNEAADPPEEAGEAPVIESRWDLLIVAGEASGDLYGARLMEELLARCRELRFFGLGGDEMLRTGLDSFAHSKEISVVGITEVLKILRRARQIFSRLVEEIDRRRPAAAVLIDFPEFNLRLAAALKKRGIPVVYYISPQVWAWRKSRVKLIAERVTRMLVLFPFEERFYRQHGVAVVHVGHPLVDEVPPSEPLSPGEGESGPKRVVLLPGSRDSEVSVLLPEMLRAVALVSREIELEVQLIHAPTVSSSLIGEQLRGSPIEVGVVRSGRFAAVGSADLALCASGTATLEVGLLGTPMVVLYRVGRWTFFLGKMLVDVPHISLVNLVLERRVVPELYQHFMTPEAIAAEAGRLLTGGEVASEMRRRLGALRERLGRGGASGRAADEVLEVMAGSGALQPAAGRGD